jgi:Skp family chaperone for outer membrane proteins
MNRAIFRIVFLGGVLFLLAFGLTFKVLQAQPGAQAGPTRVAVCNIPEVFDKYIRAQQLTQELEGQAEKIKAENDRRLDQLRTLQTTAEGLAEGSEARKQQEEQIMQQMIERQVWMQMQEDLMMRNHLRLTEELYKEIKEAIAKVAQSRNIDIVFQFDPRMPEGRNSQEMVQQIERRKVLYVDTMLDLTEPVLQNLNERHRAGG